MVKIYLDCCCLNRPFDDQLQDKIKLETDAIVAIIKKCELGIWKFFKSDVLFYEINRILDETKKQEVLLLYNQGVSVIKMNIEIEARARELQKFNIKAFDALHIACAEFKNADVFLTTDRQLLLASKMAKVEIEVNNPAIWFMEENYHE